MPSGPPRSDRSVVAEWPHRFEVVRGFQRITGVGVVHLGLDRGQVGPELFHRARADESASGETSGTTGVEGFRDLLGGHRSSAEDGTDQYNRYQHGESRHVRPHGCSYLPEVRIAPRIECGGGRAQRPNGP